MSQMNEKLQKYEKEMKLFREEDEQEKIRSILGALGIKNYQINTDGTVDVNENVYIARAGLNKFPVHFNVVKGGFYCSSNQLTSLEGAPQKVGKDFICSSCQLTSLVGAPVFVGGTFDCSSNQLTSLEGAPQKVGKDFDCEHNSLMLLSGSPKNVPGWFRAGHNQLTSLEGAPDSVGEGFTCDHNQLTSLEGAPSSVGGGFWCTHNEKQFTEQDVQAVTDVKGTIYAQEYTPSRDKQPENHKKYALADELMKFVTSPKFSALPPAPKNNKIYDAVLKQFMLSHSEGGLASYSPGGQVGSSFSEVCSEGMGEGIWDPYSDPAFAKIMDMLGLSWKKYISRLKRDDSFDETALLPDYVVARNPEAAARLLWQIPGFRKCAEEWPNLDL